MGDGRPRSTDVWCAGKGERGGQRSEYLLKILDELIRANRPDGAARVQAAHSRYPLVTHRVSPPSQSIHRRRTRALSFLPLSSLSYGTDVVDPAPLALNCFLSLFSAS